MKTLVIGGTGPTGPAIVNGLLARGHAVTILHTGRHEVDFDGPVRHLHADPHFAANLEGVLKGEAFDLSIGMYGRLAHVVESLNGRTEKFIGVGAMYYRGWIDNVMHGEAEASDRVTAAYASLPVPVPEQYPRSALEGDRFTAKGIASEDRVMDLHRNGAWQAAFLRYPAIYGPGQHQPGLWPLIQRIQAGRPVVVPDAGLLLQVRCFTETAALHVLSTVDHFDEAAGESFNVSDAYCFTLRGWVEQIALALGQPVELLSVPLFAAALSFDYSKGPFTMGHKVADTAKARNVLRLDSLPDPLDCLQRTVLWHLENPLEAADLERLRQRWDVGREEELKAAVDRFHHELSALSTNAFRFRHSYLHPNEDQTDARS